MLVLRVLLVFETETRLKSIALSESQGESAVIVGIATIRYETPDGCLLIYDL